MIFRSRHKTPDNRFFGLSTNRPGWDLLDSGDSHVEAMALGPSQSRTRWASMGSPVLLGRWRAGVFVLVTFFALLFARTAYLQVWQGEHYRDIANNNRTRVIVIPAHRGIITDRNGLDLAENVPAFHLLALPKDFPNEPTDTVQTDNQALFKAVAQELAISETNLKDKLATADPDEQILLTDDIAYDRAMAFLAHPDSFPGFTLELAEERHYFTGAIATLSHVLGYTGPLNEDDYAELKSQGYRSFDYHGKQGLEASHEQELRGVFGEEIVEVNAKGKTLRVISRREADNGQDLHLTIDATLQAYIEVSLEERLKEAPAQRASVVVMNPKNGEVLALVSYPGFDANAFASGISTEAYAALLANPNTPLFPRAVSGEFPAGSTIKPTYAAAALANGLITTDTTFMSTGGVMLGNRFFPDWKPAGHGLTNVYHAIADSVNTFFYMIGGGNEAFPGMGVEKLMTAALSFGYGQKTGIDLPGEANGFLPSKEWKEKVKGEPWYVGDTYNVSIGQGDFMVTPLQVARATAVFANEGKLVTPHLVIGDNPGGDSEPILSAEVLQIVRDGMRETVTNGTATRLQSVPVPVAGKTGTAQWSQSKHPHSWFTGFAPFDDPEIVVTVLGEEGGDLNNATAIAEDVLKWYFSQTPPVTP